MFLEPFRLVNPQATPAKSRPVPLRQPMLFAEPAKLLPHGDPAQLAVRGYRGCLALRAVGPQARWAELVNPGCLLVLGVAFRIR